MASNGGDASSWHLKQNTDGLTLPEAGGGGGAKRTVWKRGDPAEVAWALASNHGGGYSYRLCRLGDNSSSTVNEACFQRTPLAFAGTSHVLQWEQALLSGETATTRAEVPRVVVSSGTTPTGSQW